MHRSGAAMSGCVWRGKGAATGYVNMGREKLACVANAKKGLGLGTH